jgi:ATP-dependent Clp protease ATP-binding subunit ClpA
MIDWFNRHRSVITAFAALIALIQLLRQVWPSIGVSSDGWIAIQSALHAWGGYFLALGTLLGALSVACWLHWRGRLPDVVYKILSPGAFDWLTQADSAFAEAGESLSRDLWDAEALRLALTAQVVGQDDVCGDLAVQLRRRLALVHRQKPVGMFLFVGPGGTGKAHLAKVLASVLERPWVHIHLAQTSQFVPGAAASGVSSAVWAGAATPLQRVTHGLRGTPRAVVLLDSLEKAHREDLTQLVTAIGEGAVFDTLSGQATSTCQAIFVFSFDLAQDLLAALGTDVLSGAQDEKAFAFDLLQRIGVAPAVLSKMDRLCVFKPLAEAHSAEVLSGMIASVIQAYGLVVARGRVDVEIASHLLSRWRLDHASTSLDELVSALDESMAEALVQARERGFEQIALRIHGTGVRVVASKKQLDAPRFGATNT